MRARSSARGSDISVRLGHAHPESIIGVHLSSPILPGVPGDADDPYLTAEDRVMIKGQDKSQTANINALVNAADPQTLAWAMHDSPAWQAAWLLVRRRAWSDCGGDVETKFDKDTLLTHFSLYWFTNSFVSSEIFCRVSKFPEPMPLANDIKPEIIVSTAIAVMPKDLMHRSRKFVAAHTDLRQWTVMPGGAHFAPAEEPKLIVEDIRSFVRPLRQSRHRKKI